MATKHERLDEHADLLRIMYRSGASTEEITEYLDAAFIERSQAGKRLQTWEQLRDALLLFDELRARLIHQTGHDAKVVQALDAAGAALESSKEE